MRKRVFGHMRTAKSQISLCITQSDQGIYCPLTKSLDIIEYLNGEQRPKLDFAHVYQYMKSHILRIPEGVFLLEAFEVMTARSTGLVSTDRNSLPPSAFQSPWHPQV